MENILLVDDDVLSLRSVKALLEDWGYAVKAYSDPVMAFVEVKENNFSCIIVDYFMDYQNGIKLIQRIRDVLFHIPSVLISGYAEAEAEAIKNKEQVDYFLSKPIDVKELKKIIENINGRKNND